MPSELEPRDKLQRLLALKRHEVPPPGFFETFPDRVRARILAEAGRPAAPGWWSRLCAWQFWRPALAGACVALAAGLWIWQGQQRPSAPSTPSQADATAPPRWADSSLTPATASGPFPGARPGPGLGPISPETVPPGLFAPGAGLRGALVPVAATGALSGITVTGQHAPSGWPR